MEDDNLSREELLAELNELRRRVAELEAEKSSSREQGSADDEGSAKNTSDRIDGPSQLNSSEVLKIEDDYLAVMQSASEAVCITQDGLLKFVNAAATQLTGYSREELLSRPFKAFTHTDDVEELVRIYLMRLRGEFVPSGHRFRIIVRDGEVKWVESWSASITWKRRPAVLSMIRDVTRQVQADAALRQAHEELDRQVNERTAELQEINRQLLREISEREQAELSARKSENRFRQLIEHSPMGISVTDMAGEVEYLNKKFIQTFGYTMQDIPTIQHWLQLAYPDPGHADRVRSEWVRTTREALEKGAEAEPKEREVRCKDGTIRVIDFRKTVIDGRVIHTLLDITDHKRQEKALRESEQMFRLFSEQSLMSVAILQDGIYKYANRAMSDLCEYSTQEILTWGAEEFLAVVHPDDRSLVMEQARLKQMGDPRQRTQYSFRIVAKSGRAKWVEIYSKTVQFRNRGANLLTMIDVTGRKQAEKQLLQSQKMEAIGTLAGGIAHDFNNLLQAVLGYTDLLLMRRDQSDPDRQKLEIIRHAARDGADLVSRILTFSRKAESKARPIDLNEEIRRGEKLLRRTAPKMIEMELVLADDLSIIDADPAQIEQMLLNLAVNAHHAMTDGGKLLIETNNVSLSGDYLIPGLDAKPGKYVLLTVSDTGAGMSPEVLDRVFEPFFTTKSNGEGTGLGLSIVHGIVTQHGGYIRCYSEPGTGTSFKIYFPVSATDRIWESAETREMPAFGTETILLVDDDDLIRIVAKEMIEMGGYTVLTARSGEDALVMYAAHREEISLVILDLIMPGMGGKRCLEELLRINPNARVLIASGYSPNALTQDGTRSGAKGFAQKPYDAKDILAAIRKVLDAGGL
jgi:two-component system, cell cycle sensor histidine kinase and response regulator CckA